MKVGVVGNGVVGSATARAYLEHVDEVRCHDVRKERATHPLADVLECDVVFVCLPTPMREHGGIGPAPCDTSAVEGFFEQVHREDYWGHRVNYVLRSTVPIGFTRKTSERYGLPNLVHSPEFLTARCAFVDAQVPSQCVVGLTGNGFNAPVLRELYARRFPGVPVRAMSSDESEAAKLMLNGFFAVKVAYWNEVRALADRLGLGWEEMMSVVRGDGRVHPSHTQVPGPDGGFGFGGACLPKDLANLMSCMMLADASGFVTASTFFRNETIDRPRRV